ncbi:piggyBac transposable element-derived protein 4-like [Coregonus clupeaformis]|uniref:piggyBac transposable element-derived protein 4-like n=1 Tax=Coregonus clupeaformis TaxID=59861 RepID=UPI001E1C915E|nr:piggyBac transposable element-derived protein 4-like [Coregonus clupeaformis]
MPRNSFREIMRYLETDTFALVSEVWGAFVQNCVASYKPGVNIAVEEQWFPAKAKCSFTQYIPYKQDKWGMKFRLAADVHSKYVLNVFPYLGKGEQPENVVMRLVEPYLGEGRNVNTDDFFTSLPLANKLIDKNTSLVGVIEASRGLPPSVSNQAQAELFSTTVLKHDKATLTVYRCKPRENVCILSTMHPTVAIGGDTKRKTETLTHYNNTTVGVDKMARQFTVKAATQRWPVAVFYNLLDLAAINAHVLFTLCTGRTMPRREFIMQLVLELRENHIRAGGKAAAHDVPNDAPPLSEKNIQCQVHG